MENKKNGKITKSEFIDVLTKNYEFNKKSLGETKEKLVQATITSNKVDTFKHLMVVIFSESKVDFIKGALSAVRASNETDSTEALAKNGFTKFDVLVSSLGVIYDSINKGFTEEIPKVGLENIKPDYIKSGVEKINKSIDKYIEIKIKNEDKDEDLHFNAVIILHFYEALKIIGEKMLGALDLMTDRQINYISFMFSNILKKVINGYIKIKSA